MTMDIRYFHDEKSKDLLPLTCLNEPQELRCGMLTLDEKIRFALNKSKLSKDCVIFVNSRLLICDEIKKEIKNKAHSFVLVNGGTVVLAVIKGSGNVSAGQIEELCAEKITVKHCLIEYPWELIFKNAEEISADMTIPSVKAGFKLKRKNIFIGKGAKIHTGVVLDAENGPVVIDDGAVIMANSVVYGPAYIGKGTIVKALSKIYGGTSIGPMCKAGGEIESSIFQGYANKQHEGFIGHSFVGEWVNLGAGTNNSDLKNNYTNIKMPVNGKDVDTGKMFMGAVIGDHTKTGINTMINTGTVIGISCNLFGAGYLPKHVPSFSWGGPDRLSQYRIDKAVEAARAAMKRRNVEMTREYESLIMNTFNSSSTERKT
jgi:UDP-N-acetylglucosamine diphosphorylase / glucose-1-phosphate thymidylyltransferase / UDP-N-acetylgalactosamine diphosphorylase / glucosamine-1-phosphate N-acetyltransferase / galactosamine-1-phosphate N-acetyltransferase